MQERFWRWLARFAYRRLVATVGPEKAKWGMPGLRDFDNACRYYSPHPMHVVAEGDAHPWMACGCMGDGHALCQECYYLEKMEDIENETRDHR